MIEMQYNFPLLPGLASLWRERLAASVASLSNDAFDELRPTFRSDQHALTDVAANWMNMPPERTHLLEGNHHGSLVAMMAMGLAGHPLAVDSVAYTGAIVQATALGSPLIGCDVDAEGMVPASLHAHCMEARQSSKQIKAMYVIPTVNNPLGCVASLARREALVEVARKFDLLILEDDAYAYMAPDAPPPLATLAPERTFYIRGLSKSFAPAARTGFLVAPERFANAIQTAIRNTVTGASLVHARAAVSMIADGTVDRVIAEKNVEGAIRNAAARKLLGANTCWPGAPAAWHLWVNLPQPTSSLDFEQRMLDRGVVLSAGQWFATNANAPNGFRIALGGEVDRERTLEGVALIAAELRESNSVLESKGHEFTRAVSIQK